MGAVVGRVVQLETGAPVSNLVVAAFDMDPATDAERSDLRRAHRLGSAVVTADGSFRIEFAEEHLRATMAGHARRPDITLALYRPHVAGAAGNPEAEPLYVTRAPRQGAAREEAFVVMVPRGVWGPGPTRTASQRPAEPVEGVVRDMASRAAFDSAMSRVMAPVVARQLAVRAQGAALARDVLGAARRRQGAAAELFVPPGQSTVEATKTARAAGLRRLRDIAPRVKPLVIRTDSRGLKKLGFQQTQSGVWVSPAGGTTLSKVEAQAGPGVFTTDAMRAFNAIDLCQSMHAGEPDAVASNGGSPAAPSDDAAGTPGPPTAGNLDAGGTATGTGGASDNGGSATGGGSAPVEGLQADVLALARAAVYGLDIDSPAQLALRPNADAVKTGLSVDLPGGPADQASLHDFHTLQVAWRDVWTAIIDAKTQQQLIEVYEALVPVVDWGSIASDTSEITELRDFLAHLKDATEVAAKAAGAGDPPAELAAWLPELADKWAALSPEHRDYMDFLHWVDNQWEQQGLVFWFTNVAPGGGGTSLPGGDIKEYLDRAGTSFPDAWFETPMRELHAHWGRERGEAILFGYDSGSSSGGGGSWVPGLARAGRLLQGIADRLAEAYRFDVFAPGSYNYGIVTTYRQKWQPLHYQVGELVATIPLAPGEKRSYTKKRVVRASRAQKEVERALAARTGESTETSRWETDILRKASASTNFKLTAEGGFNVAIADFRASGAYGADQAQESSVAKRSYREAVRKASEEYRKERTLEISSERTLTDEFTETAEIVNTNDELTVTYLLYELQRLLEISERLHRVTPVVLVAFEVPAPNEIDEDWLLTQEWILRRVILDDGLVPALDYLSDGFASDELGVEVLRTQWETQIDTVRRLTSDLSIRESLRQQARTRLDAALRAGGSSGGGALDMVGDFLFGDDDSAAKAEARRQAAQQAMDWTDADFTRAEQQLATSMSALAAATDAYNEALRRRLNRRVAIDQLRIHVKENILYYMQAIWLHEPPDQRYLRLYDREVGWPDTTAMTVQVTKPEPTTPPPGPSGPSGSGGGGGFGGFGGLGDIGVDVQGTYDSWVSGIQNLADQQAAEKVQVQVPLVDFGDATRVLYEVADLDRLLGFKGNYGIFPLKQHNAVTLFMAQAFLDTYFGVTDPDILGEVPAPSEAVELAECAWHKAGNDEGAKREITKWLLAALENQRLVSEQIVVPTGQLYIDALPGVHPLLEDFKLRHRQIDTLRAGAELRQAQLEALRYASRIAAGERGDPEVQTQVLTAAPVSIDLPAQPSPNPTP